MPFNGAEEGLILFFTTRTTSLNLLLDLKGAESLSSPNLHLALQTGENELERQQRLNLDKAVVQLSDSSMSPRFSAAGSPRRFSDYVSRDIPSQQFH